MVFKKCCITTRTTFLGKPPFRRFFCVISSIFDWPSFLTTKNAPEGPAFRGIHLLHDLYGQLYGGGFRVFRGVFRGEFQLDAVALPCRQRAGICELEPVSYTHLDVYKRQG